MTASLRLAVISDIHGNLHALEAVLAEIDGESVDELWSLGDTVGYGPRPNECCALTRDRVQISLVGNHDLVAIGELSVSEFNEDAAAAALWTSRVLDGASREFLRGLEPRGERAGVRLFHGSARDPVWEYILTDEAARATLDAIDEDLVLVGHSHVALAVTEVDDGVAGGVVPGSAELPLEDARWLLNPGSVGQPRDGDPRAAWLLLDLERRHATFRRVEYPIERTQQEMREAALPELLAARLAHGE
jgi:diadenosine tetraphosphatase ApaH/serine/threonine PP2A family protein phosphatase